VCLSACGTSQQGDFINAYFWSFINSSIAILAPEPSGLERLCCDEEGYPADPTRLFGSRPSRIEIKDWVWAQRVANRRQGNFGASEVGLCDAAIR
jgi:hypothetical protein